MGQTGETGADTSCAASGSADKAGEAPTLTPFATGPQAVGRYRADIVVGATTASTEAYVDRDHVSRSSEASYDPLRERNPRDATERCAPAYVG
ncbi:hypothetical protein [Streptomyces sp. NPDC058466]|uniref:hypothetical protein n=1 Tax=unclassified Streptomyces TaxID=2593676 RepID=UPI00364E495E